MNRPLREINHGGFLKALSTISPTSSTPGASSGGALPVAPARTALGFSRTDTRRGSAAVPRDCADASFVVVMVRRRQGTTAGSGQCRSTAVVFADRSPGSEVRLIDRRRLLRVRIRDRVVAQDVRRQRQVDRRG